MTEQYRFAGHSEWNIIESGNEWIVSPIGYSAVTAAEALKFVKLQDAIFAKDNPESVKVSRVTWHPTTRVGRLVVEALTKSRR